MLDEVLILLINGSRKILFILLISLFGIQLSRISIIEYEQALSIVYELDFMHEFRICDTILLIEVIIEVGWSMGSNKLFLYI
jgi:hypothetical protein